MIGIMVVFEKFLENIILVVLKGNLNGSERVKLSVIGDVTYITLPTICNLEHGRRQRGAGRSPGFSYMILIQ